MITISSQLQIVFVVLSCTCSLDAYIRKALPSSSSQVRSHLHVLKMASTVGMSDVSSQIKDMRAAMRADEKTALMMDALRGKNLNDDDRQGDGIDMQVVRVRGADDAFDVLPTVYNPVRLEAYFSKRPGAVATRVWQVLYASSAFLAGILFDKITGSTDDVEVKRAAQLRSVIYTYISIYTYI
jgi:aarF domain-containing kinase